MGTFTAGSYPLWQAVQPTWRPSSLGCQNSQSRPTGSQCSYPANAPFPCSASDCCPAPVGCQTAQDRAAQQIDQHYIESDHPLLLILPRFASSGWAQLSGTPVPAVCSSLPCLGGTRPGFSLAGPACSARSRVIAEVPQGTCATLSQRNPRTWPLSMLHTKCQHRSVDQHPHVGGGGAGAAGGTDPVAPTLCLCCISQSRPV